MKLRTVMIAVAGFALLSTPGAADELPTTVPETVGFIRDKLEQQGFEIEALIDHSAAAASVGLVLPPTQVLFFGRQKTDQSLIRRGQKVALDLPLRFLVWEDDAGVVQIDTNRVGYHIDRHELPTFDFLFLLLGGVLGQFGGLESGILMVESERSFDDTVAALLEDLEGRGFRIPFSIDYAERAGRRHRIRPTTIVAFGNPNVGTPLMQNSRSIGLDLPQKMLVFEDAHGRVKLAYNDPFFLGSKHDVVGEDARLGAIAAALQNIAETAGGIAP